MSLSDRVSGLESKVEGIDSEIIDGISSSVRSVIAKNEETARQALNELALQAIKNVLDGFPEHAKVHVVELFEVRLQEAFALAKEEADMRHYQHTPPQPKPRPIISDLLRK